MIQNGVKKEKPEHYAQMVIYMDYMKLTRALYFVVNKNTDEIYTERIKEDPAEAKRLRLKAKQIITANTPPVGISQNPAWYKCKFCDFWNHCFNYAWPEANCRTCVHSTPIVNDTDDQRWACERKCRNIELTPKIGCIDHLYIPEFINYFAEVVDANKQENWIEYKCKAAEGVVFRNVSKGYNDPDRYCFTSSELTNLTVDEFAVL